MKKCNRMWMVGICMLVLAGCQTTPESKKGEQALLTKQVEQPEEEKNPFDLEEIEKSGQIIQASYGWTVANYDPSIRRIDLGEETSTDLIMELESRNACEVGYMMFIDGIPQQYRMGEKEGYLIPVDCEQGVSSAALNVTPTVPDTEKEHIVNFVCLYHPSFRVSEEETHYGNYHNLSQLLPWKISGTFSETDIAIVTDVTYQPIPEDIKEQYVRVNRDGTVVKQYETVLYSKFYQNGTETERFDGGENTQLVLFGGKECSYRVSLFVDHHPVAAFSGAEYIDVTMKNEQMAVMDLDFSEELISDYSCVYAILCPLDSMGNDADRLVEKTASITLFQ
ncbi:MAG: hypothetical protein J1E35_05905 [Lachnospiraceae bacterium]|nr:hypothetical protein [Lachnospiraceae bacterium]